MEKTRRRRLTREVTIGRSPGMRVWLDPNVSGIHFRIDDQGSAVTLRGTWEVQAQGMLLVDLRFSGRRWERPEGPSGLLEPPKPLPPVHVSSTELRRVSVPELERRVREAIRQHAAEEADHEHWLARARQLGYDIPALVQPPRNARNLLARIGPEQLRPGRNGYPLDLYTWVASEYLRLVERSERPILGRLAERASERLGRPVTTGNVRDWVRRARELGLLSPGVRGKATAKPGPNLHAPSVGTGVSERSDARSRG